LKFKKSNVKGLKIKNNMKYKIRNIFALIFLIICFTVKSNAQETKVTGDLEQWTSIGISKKINKNWKISLDQEIRFSKDISQFDVYLADLGLDYKINKHFTVGANYRFYQNKDSEGDFQTQFRWNTDLQYKHKINRFTLAYRIRFQDKGEDFLTSQSNSNLYNLRNKFSVDYNIKSFKIDPFFDVELYRQIDDINTTELSKLRWTLGLEYSLKNYGNIELFYRIDNELNQSYNKDTYILGVGYKFSF
jgi:predicted porin